jgi:hypothetical protein
MYAELTKLASGYGAPAVRTFSRGNKGFIGDDGTQYPASIFTLWSDAELVAIGLARVDESPIPADKRSSGSSQHMLNKRLQITHTLMDKPPPAPVIEPSPSDEDYAGRWEGYRRESYPDIGDQLDAILKWANLMRLNGTDLPAGLDDIVASWLAVKTKYPKPVVEEDIEGGAV